MDRLIDFYKNAYEGLRQSPEDYFKKDYPLLDAKMVHALCFGGWLFYFVLAGFAAGGLFGSAISTAFAIVFMPVPVVLTLLLATGYVLVFCNLFFGKPTDFAAVWRLFVTLGAILVPATLLAAILGFIPVIGSIASLALAVLSIYVSYLGCRHVLELSLPQFVILHIPPVVLGAAAMIAFFAATATLHKSYDTLSKLPTDSPSSWKEVAEKNAEVMKKLSAKQKGIPKGKKAEAPRKADEKSEKTAKKTKLEASPELRAGDTYSFSFVDMPAKGKKAKGKITLRIRPAKGKGDDLLVTMVMQVGKKKESEKFELEAGATYVDFNKELVERLAVKSKRSIARFDAIAASFVEAQAAAKLAKDHGSQLKNVSASFGLSGTAVASALPKPSGTSKVAGRAGKRYEVKGKGLDLVVVRDASLGFPLLSHKEKRGGSQMTFRLKSFKGGKS